MNKTLIFICDYIAQEFPKKQDFPIGKIGRFLRQYYALRKKRDTSDVWRQFAIWMLVDEEYGVIRFTKPGSEQYKAIQQVAQLYIEDCKNSGAWEAAKRASYDASLSTAYYTTAFSYSRAAAAARVAAGYAIGASETLDATYAQYAAYANTRAFADATYLSADDAHHERMADKLIELINASPRIK